MCFKPPAPPKPTAEELAREAEQEQMIENQKADSAAKLAEDKMLRTQSTFGQQSGMYGMRSLISGPKGGAGFY
jgi:hypothetical protein